MGYYSDDSDSDGDMLSTCEIEAIARRHGYRKVQHDHREGVIAFSRPDENGYKQLVRVWYRTGTVGTYLKHPTRGKAALFRKNVGRDYAMLERIFENPRAHTGQGYYRKRRR